MSTITFTPSSGAALVFDGSLAAPSFGWDSFREEPSGPRLREFTFPGIGGAAAVVLGAAPRQFTQAGRLLAASESELASMRSALRAAASGSAGALSVRGGAESFPNTLLVSVRFTAHGRDAAGHWARYELGWRQLSP